MGPEMFPPGGRQRYLVQSPSTEGANNGRNSPSRKPAAYRPLGKTTKRPSLPTDPSTTPEGEAGVGGPSSAGKMKATHPPKTMKCTLCGRVCTGLKGFNKHHKEVHMGT